jgi:hypothetical protein
MSGRRRAGIVTLLALLAGALALPLAPFDLAAVRLAGVSLLWWYAAVVAPLLAVAVAVLAVERP